MTRLVLVLSICLGVVTLWASVATYKWVTASARCRVTVAEAETKAVNAERDRALAADRAAASLFARVQAEVRSDLAEANESTGERATRIIRVPVTGLCVMPKGLPELGQAVKEARDAAAD